MNINTPNVLMHLIFFALPFIFLVPAYRYVLGKDHAFLIKNKVPQAGEILVEKAKEYKPSYKSRLLKHKIVLRLVETNELIHIDDDNTCYIPSRVYYPVSGKEGKTIPVTWVSSWFRSEPVLVSIKGHTDIGYKTSLDDWIMLIFFTFIGVIWEMSVLLSCYITFVNPAFINNEFLVLLQEASKKPK